MNSVELPRSYVAKDSNEVSINLARLSPLLGIWRGTGRGKFPAIEAFDYTEELKFESNSCEPLIHFEQKTWVESSTETNGSPLHWESGFIRPVEDGSIEISNAQNGGRVEVLKGRIDVKEYLKGILLLSLESVLFGNDPRLVQTRRTFRLKDNTLSYLIEMATVRTPNLQPHLEASLTRASS
ncbi:MAG TPA: FABP family protein [Pyrinomonadaceae bacterium]|nr:FABP family protein [Pyrinomonadaceae bacterium]